VIATGRLAVFVRVSRAIQLLRQREQKGSCSSTSAHY
jgi:hypothetical protein